MSDAMGEHTGLARAGAGDHEQWAITMHDRIELFGIEAVGKRTRTVVIEHLVRTATVIPLVVRLVGRFGRCFRVRRHHTTPGRVVGEQLGLGRIRHDPVILEKGCGDAVASRELDRKRISVAAIGPSITLSLNSLVVTSVLINPRLVDGYCGLLVEQRNEGPVEMAVEWCQFRHIW